MTSDSPRLRLGVVAIVVVSLFGALLARAYYLQVLASPEYKLLAKVNSIRTVLEPAPRGRILDRNGVVLVGNKASNIVAVDRARMPQKDQAEFLSRLAEVLMVGPEVLAKRLADTTASPYTPVPVADNVDERAMIELRERQDEFPGVVARQVAVREYPFQSLAAHVLGYVGEINEAELAERAAEYELGDAIGKAGVEQYYERDLRGTPGQLRLEVDSEGRPVRVVGHKRPVQGSDVVLSIDLEIQRVAEDSLREGLEQARRLRFQDDKTFLKANAGAAVALDAQEGTVLAMASYPSFDLPGLADGVSVDEFNRVFKSSDGKEPGAFVNNAIEGNYAPGSTWKIVTADAALRSGLIDRNHTIDDKGTFVSANCVENDRTCRRRNAGSKAFGLVDTRRALAVSSDVFFYGIGDRFWIERKRFGETPMQDVAKALGFGEETGVPLARESSGRLATPAARAELHDKNPVAYPNGDWFQGDNVNLAIGQAELNVTPIQLANAYAAYANGGIRFQPNLALRVQRQDGTLVRAFSRREKARIELPPQVHEPIMQGLAGVLTDREGTAKDAFAGFPLDQYRIAGKTGTAQRPPKQDDALFVGVGPMQDPRHAVAVVMEQSGFGASTAAPVARKIFAKLAGIDEQAAVVPVIGARD